LPELIAECFAPTVERISTELIQRSSGNPIDANDGLGIWGDRDILGGRSIRAGVDVRLPELIAECFAPTVERISTELIQRSSGNPIDANDGLGIWGDRDILGGRSIRAGVDVRLPELIAECFAPTVERISTEPIQRSSGNPIDANDGLSIWGDRGIF
jgi:hypothetical protein